jgi:threonine synthase
MSLIESLPQVDVKVDVPRTAPGVSPAAAMSHIRPSVPNLLSLRCASCGHRVPIAAVHVCDQCMGPLEPEYDVEAIATRVSRASIEAGPASLWRYADLLPTLSADPAHRVDLGAGWTPLRPAPRLGERLGLDDLWLKDDTRNPSGSFKDRVVTVAISAARALGIDTIACASTGNLAGAVAAAAAATGMRAYVFIPSTLERSKVLGAAVYGAEVVPIDGTYDDVNRLCSELADEYGWGFVNLNLRPFYAQGSTTIGYEIAEQLGWSLPDHVVVPIASGAMLSKIDEAFGRLVHYGLVEAGEPRISGAQASGCAPVARAFERGDTVIVPERPDTIARSLAIGSPADGANAVTIAQRTGGAIGHVDDPAIIDGIRLLAETEGIFAETAGGVTVATLAQLARSGAIDRSERTVAIISGNGYKTAEVLEGVVGGDAVVPKDRRGAMRALEARG